MTVGELRHIIIRLAEKHPQGVGFKIEGDALWVHVGEYHHNVGAVWDGEAFPMFMIDALEFVVAATEQNQ
jgi:hypothetical protein